MRVLTIPATTCQWCEASIPIRGPLCSGCGRFGTPGYTTDQLDAVLEQLSPSHRNALTLFNPMTFYGPGLPAGIPKQMKPRLAAMGLLRRETRNGRSTPWYGLSFLGERLRARFASVDTLPKGGDGETGSVRSKGGAVPPQAGDAQP